MYVVSYTLQYSNNGRHWIPYSDDEDVTAKVSCDKITNSTEPVHWFLCL